MEEAWTGFAIYTMWEVESFPMWQDYNVVVFSALVYPLVRFSLDTCIYKRLAEWVIFRNGETGFEKRQRHDESKKVSKFMESAWKLTYYTTSVCLAMFISSGEPWIGNTDAFWHGWPHQTLKFRLKIFYSLQCGFYIYSVAALILWETRRKDFKVMMSHHIITIGLISCSYITGSFRVGSVVLVLHDVSDVLLESAKLCKYSELERSAAVLFGLFTFSWALLRLGYFPFWIIKSTRIKAVSFAMIHSKLNRITQQYEHPSKAFTHQCGKLLIQIKTLKRDLTSSVM
ncbi:unnamed protein product [Calypogeia fissa]